MTEELKVLVALLLLFGGQERERDGLTLLDFFLPFFVLVLDAIISMITLPLRRVEE